MGAISGFNQNTAEHLLLDAGALFINFDINTDTVETAKTKLLGATSGGNTFNAIPEFRDIQVDGVKGAAKGLKVLNSWEVTLETNSLEITDATLKYALASGESSDTTLDGKNYKKVTAKNELALTDYVDNITWIGTISGSQDPVIIVIKNALSTNGLSINPQDNADIVTTLTFMGHYDATNLSEPPFEIYYPTI